MRKTLAVLAVLSLMLIGLAAPAGAKPDERPFKAVFSGDLFWTEDLGCASATSPPLRTNFDVAGNATHMGRTTMSGSHCTPGGLDYGPSVLTFTAANGDTIDVAYWGTCEPWFDLESGDVLPCTVEMEAVGGTGRFADATLEGSGMLWITWLVSGGMPADTMPGWWAIEGTVGY